MHVRNNNAFTAMTSIKCSTRFSFKLTAADSNKQKIEICNEKKVKMFMDH